MSISSENFFLSCIFVIVILLGLFLYLTRKRQMARPIDSQVSKYKSLSASYAQRARVWEKRSDLVECVKRVLYDLFLLDITIDYSTEFIIKILLQTDFLIKERKRFIIMIEND